MQRTAILALLLTSSAWATNNQDHTCQGGHNCNTTETGGGDIANTNHNDADANAWSGSSSKSDADANSVAFGGQGGKGGNADAVAVTSQGQDQGQSQTALASQGQQSTNFNSTSQGQSADNFNSVNTGANQGQSLVNADLSRYLALDLPGATADEGSTAECLESRRGWTFAGFGASGRTRLNAACDADRTDRREFEQCIVLAQAYVGLGHPETALSQLAQCGGVTIIAKPEPVAAPVCDTTERDKRIFEACQTK